MAKNLEECYQRNLVLKLKYNTTKLKISLKIIKIHSENSNLNITCVDLKEQILQRIVVLKAFEAIKHHRRDIPKEIYSIRHKRLRIYDPVKMIIIPQIHIYQIQLPPHSGGSHLVRL